MKIAALFLCLNAATAFVAPSPRTTVASTSLGMSSVPGDFWSDKPLHKPQDTTPVADKNVNWIERATMKDVVIDPDYTLTWAVALLGFLIPMYHPSQFADGTPSLIGLAGGCFHFVFAALLWVQTRRVRCVFEKDGFEFYNIKGPSLDFEKGAYLEKKPANYVAGTENRWKYDSIINYGFFPSIDYPVICYFKETETPEWKWDRWFAAFDSYGRGQPHFFPGICSARQFKEQMELRGVKRKQIPTFKKD